MTRALLDAETTAIDDIVGAVSGGRVAAISAVDDSTEQLVAIGRFVGAHD